MTNDTSDSAGSRRVAHPCIVCAEQIPLAALKCKHCESYQDWRRWIPFSDTVLALLVALISILTTFFTVTTSLWPKAEEVAIVRIAPWAAAQLELTLENSGTAAGVIDMFGFITVPGAKDPHRIVVTAGGLQQGEASKESDVVARIVKPGEILRYYLWQPAATGIVAEALGAKGGRCRLVLRVFSRSGSDGREIGDEFDCDSLAGTN